MSYILSGEVVARTALWPLGTVAYSQTSTASPTGHRCDCSGFVSMCLRLATPGLTTVTLVTTGTVYAIAWSDLRPGDLVGRMGADTGGDSGHVMTVVEVTATRYRVVHQPGGMGPKTAWFLLGSDQGVSYKPYRGTYVTEDVTMALNDADSQALIWRVEALVHFRDTVIGGPTKDEPVELVRAIKALTLTGGGGTDPAVIQQAVVDALTAHPLVPGVAGNHS